MKWMYVMVTNFTRASHLNRAMVSYEDESNGVELSLHPTYTEGLIELHKLEKKLNRKAECHVNKYNKSIVVYELSGYMD